MEFCNLLKLFNCLQINVVELQLERSGSVSLTHDCRLRELLLARTRSSAASLENLSQKTASVNEATYVSGVCFCPRCQSRLETFSGHPDEPNSTYKWPEDSCPGGSSCSFKSVSKYSLQSGNNSGKYFVCSLQNPDSDRTSIARYQRGSWGKG